MSMKKSLEMLEYRKSILESRLKENERIVAKLDRQIKKLGSDK